MIQSQTYTSPCGRFCSAFQSCYLNVVPVLILFVASYSIVTAQISENVKSHIKYLASEELAGRSPGTEGNKKAAQYIAEHFKSHGIKPLGDSYFQEFSVITGVRPSVKNSAVFELIIPKLGIPSEMIKPVKLAWKLGMDFQPLSSTANGAAAGRIVFAGYGITSKEKSYDDYDGVDVKGAIVVVLRGTPDGVSTEARTSWGMNSSSRAKMTNARDRGALAMILVNEQGDSADKWQTLKPESNSGLIVVQARRTPIAKIFSKDQTLFDTETWIIKNKKPKSFVLPNVSVSMNVDLIRDSAMTSNVIGVIPGTDPSRSEEYIVIGGHFDHLGTGDEGSLHSHAAEKAIHYGADDNASGTAGMLELATKFSEKPIARPVIVMGFNAEEKGLLGSKHYVEQPLVPLAKTMCMVNMDMIGRLKDGKLNVQGTESASMWNPLIDSFAKPFNLTISKTADGFGPSDHSSFYSKDIPVLFFFTGLHSDYHRPTDTWDKINYEGEAQVINYIEEIIRAIGNGAEKPVFHKVASTSSMQSRSAGSKVSFGIIPDYSDHPKGLKISGVREGSPAQKGGLKSDDVIVKYNETTVKNIYDFMTAMGNSNPGDVVNVVVIRGPNEDQEVKLKVTVVAKGN